MAVMMIEVRHNLFVGNQADYERDKTRLSEWHIIHACKEPYLKQSGYVNNHCVILGNRLILNLIDADDVKYINKTTVNAAIRFIHLSLHDNHKVLIHCNKGHSRAPVIALLYLLCNGDIQASNAYDAEDQFIKLYPSYHPNPGMRQFLYDNFDKYTDNRVFNGSFLSKSGCESTSRS